MNVLDVHLQIPGLRESPPATGPSAREGLLPSGEGGVGDVEVGFEGAVGGGLVAAEGAGRGVGVVDVGLEEGVSREADAVSFVVVRFGGRWRAHVAEIPHPGVLPRRMGFQLLGFGEGLLALMALRINVRTPKSFLVEVVLLDMPLQRLLLAEDPPAARFLTPRLLPRLVHGYMPAEACGCCETLPALLHRRRTTLPAIIVERGRGADVVRADISLKLTVLVLDMPRQMLSTQKRLITPLLSTSVGPVVGVAAHVDLQADGAVEGFAAVFVRAEVFLRALSGGGDGCEGCVGDGLVVEGERGAWCRV